MPLQCQRPLLQALLLQRQVTVLIACSLHKLQEFELLLRHERLLLSSLTLQDAEN